MGRLGIRIGQPLMNDNLRLDGGYDLSCNLIVHLEQIVTDPIKPISPNMVTTGCLDKLGRKPETIPGGANAPFHNVAGAHVLSIRPMSAARFL